MVKLRIQKRKKLSQPELVSDPEKIKISVSGIKKKGKKNRHSSFG